jgi:cation-transporting ATPase 13A1
MATIAGTFLWDRLCLLVFAPQSFAAVMSEARQTTFKDLQPVLWTLAKVVGVVAVLGSGYLLLGGTIWYFYRNYQNQQKPGGLQAATIPGARRG